MPTTKIISIIAVLFVVPVARVVSILARRITQATYKAGKIEFKFGCEDKKRHSQSK
ncbi:MAG: hypothetical protein ABSD29_20110 [Verrucomicrobiota bacterium]